MRMMLRRLALYPCIAFALAACTSAPQQEEARARLDLRLQPAALGTSISLQQHLRVERGERVDHLDAALEVDAERLTMIGLALGQRVMSLEFDGTTLQTWRHALLPQQVRAEDVLEDIQLTYWPAAAIRAALPPGWRIEEAPLRRTLWAGNTRVTDIEYSAEPAWHGTVVLSNLRYRYRLTIQSVSANH